MQGITENVAGISRKGAKERTKAQRKPRFLVVFFAPLRLPCAFAGKFFSLAAVVEEDGEVMAHVGLVKEAVVPGKGLPRGGAVG